MKAIKTRLVSIRITPEQYSQLEKDAQRLHMTVSDLMRLRCIPYEDSTDIQK